MPSRKGSPNKNKEFLMIRLKSMYGDDFDPIMKAAENAVRMQVIADDFKDGNVIPGEEMTVDVAIEEFGLREKCVNSWDKIAQYTTPKLKALEVDLDVGVKDSLMSLLEKIDEAGPDEPEDY